MSGKPTEPPREITIAFHPDGMDVVNFGSDILNLTKYYGAQSISFRDYVLADVPAAPRKPKPCEGKSHRFGCPYDNCPDEKPKRATKKKRSKA